MEKNILFIWGMFVAFTMESVVFMGKKYLNNCQSIAKATDLTLKCSTYLQDWSLTDKMRSQDWKQLVGRIIHEKTVIDWWSKSYQQDSIRCRSVEKSNVYSWDYMRHQKISGRIILMSMFNDIFCWSKDNEKECLANAKFVRISVWKKVSKRTVVICWSWLSKEEVLHQWRQSTRSMGQYRRKNGGIPESECPIFRASSPLSRGQLKSKRHGKLSIHYAADLETFETYVQLSLQISSVFTEPSRRYEVNESFPRENGETRCDGAIEFFTRAQCEQERSSFGLWWPGQPTSSIAAI